MAPGGEMFNILRISTKTHRVPGRVKTLPYSKNETCTKLSNNNFYSEVIDIIQRFCRDGNRKMLIPQPPGRAAGR